MLLLEQAPKTLRKRSPKVWAAIDAYVERMGSTFPDEIVSIILYGSRARGEAQRESDIDLLVVVRQLTPLLREALTDVAWYIQLDYGVVISDIVRSEEEFQQMRHDQFPYYRSLEREGLILWQTPSRPMPV